MNKPLSETHPDFFLFWKVLQGTPISTESLVFAVQKTTIDKAEHQRIVAEHERIIAEVANHSGAIGEMRGRDDALRRVKEAIETEIEDWNKGTTPEQKYVDHCVKAALVRLRDYRLGLDEKVKP
jgi:hypothetical protein